MKEHIGFIGQGWIGKHYADDFEQRGYSVVRYGLESEYAANKENIATCGIVFIAVPTPTNEQGFDASIVEAVLSLVGKGNVAVLKSTMLPGTTKALQEKFPDILVLNSPEFLREKNAAYDAAHPERTLIGIPRDTEEYHAAAQRVLGVLPPAPYTRVLRADAAELVKYAGNVFLALKVIFANELYDLSTALGQDYGQLSEALAADPRVGASHLEVLSASGHSDTVARGAGGHCFIKDLEAFRRLYALKVGDREGNAHFAAVVAKNNRLLIDSGKDTDLLEGVYGASLNV